MAQQDVRISRFTSRRLTFGQVAVHALLIGVCLACLVPLVIIVSASFTDEETLVNNGFRLVPAKLSLVAYQFLLLDPGQILHGYAVSTFVTTTGSALGLLVMAMLAYVMSRRDFPYRNVLAFVVFFTLLFQGGLVPFYIVVTQTLHLNDTIWVLILPYLVVPFFVLLLRTYFASLPFELIEAAKIDGASELHIFFRIVLPLSTPALATVGLFLVLRYWNDFWLPLLFIDNHDLYPLQYLLFNILKSLNSIQSSAQTTGVAAPLETVRMAMAVVAIGPVLVVFLAVQRYFVRGITLGGLKG
ncbi:MAG: carbohydrate ABC transporter permease [Chloroflexi bacterium]|nr:carbohydrate ABC transporter permease [Chloroflexota bacterium]